MKKFLLLFLIFPTLLAAQDVDSTSSEKKKIFNFVEDMAEFPGGQNALAKWLVKKLKYPGSAVKMRREGKVFVKFIVEPDGSITGAEVLKGFDTDCDEEALRVISIMPKWKPGKQSGEAVRSYFTQVVYFKLGR